ncbi:LysR family transcriptional regulator [Variovorax paradoxus]|uniref:LysR family transcriptional regulator n=1 Tax=Variovorax paradoxus TaxID=34073 RepID=UPI00278B7D2B|nr:LysR family transcriptional regulator [Variovorax paradoxus]MDQ0590009.1 DNA-binding transcriptional LysR family regulator [Variovorax paradoxus]
MVVSDIDVRLLKVFRAVVESGGFANAQAILNVGTSTISTQMSQLETRLGYVLCHRGRSGFRLTEKGESFYRLVIELFQSVQNFEVQAGSLRGGMEGQLRIGFIDNIITDPMSPFRGAIEDFRRHPRNRARLLLEVLSPQDLERALQEHRLDVAIGVFYSRLRGLAYEQLYQQRDVLVCHRDHPLAQIQSEIELAQALPASNKVLRSFLGTHEFPFVSPGGASMITSVSHIEAAALLILTGDCIGFLPRHYIKQWVNSGELVELLPDQLYRDTHFSIATRADQQHTVPALHVFLSCLRAAKVHLDGTVQVRLAA